ncbi:MAG: hypothetical protein J5I93_04620 [Pirellulaceae bacterium]|nr:hypothetical protein [Pirellulaceae bacterium]
MSRALACLLLAAACAACGRSGPSRYAASGSVTLGGQPLDQASIIFEPRGKGGLVVAAPVVNGQFAWTERNGPAAGEYDVRVNPHGVDETEARQIVQQNTGRPIESVSVPARYQRPGELTATVTPAGPNQFEFDLESR